MSPFPKDLSKIKSKVLFNLTKRQLICFGCGALLGVPLFFLLRKPLGNSSAAMVMMLVMLPAFLLGMYERNGQPLDIIAVCFQRPKVRPYRTNNFYALLERQDQLEREVYSIVHGGKTQSNRQTDQSGEKADRRADRKSKGRG